MEASISQLDTAEDKMPTVIARDVTERVRAQEDLADIRTEANAIREQEKSRVARELHDELAQSLTALKMDAIWVQDKPRTRCRQRRRAKLADSAGHARRQPWRHAPHSRRPAAAAAGRPRDSMPAIDWLVQNFDQRTGIPLPNSERTRSWNSHEPHATAVFRIVQERWPTWQSMPKAKRSVSVAIVRGGGRPALKVRDDGVGFDPDAARKPQSLGLAGLRERVQLLKGTISGHSQPGQGTTVDACIPVG